MSKTAAEDLKTIATTLTRMKILKTMSKTITYHNSPLKKLIFPIDRFRKVTSADSQRIQAGDLHKELTKKRENWHMKISSWSSSKVTWLPVLGNSDDHGDLQKTEETRHLSLHLYFLNVFHFILHFCTTDHTPSSAAAHSLTKLCLQTVPDDGSSNYEQIYCFTSTE